MRRIIIIYGLVLAVLVTLLKMLEYKYMVHDVSMELYMGIIATLFTAVGIWLGFKLIQRKKETIIKEVLVPVNDYVKDEAMVEKLGISVREYDVLEQMSQGLSNQEIADVLFISLNTVKTHAANLYMKLDVKRRTQAIQKAKELRIIP